MCMGTMGTDPWVDRETFPLLFEVEGTPCVLSPTFLGVDIFVLMPMVFIG